MALVSWTIERHVSGGIVRAGFTSRAGGVSTGSYGGLNLGYHVGDDPDAVTRNRMLLSQELGTLPGWMDQVHGDAVAPALPDATQPQTDGLLVRAAPVGKPAANAPYPISEAACVMVADCAPLLLMGTDGLRGAAVHVGRAGFLKGIAPKAVRELGNPDKLVAVIGPAICGACYEVPASLRDEAARVASSAASETSWGTPSIDIRRGLRQQLRAAGVQQIVETGVCTRESDEFFSHRRSSQEGQAAGRFVGIIQCISDTPASFMHAPSRVEYLENCRK